MALPVAGGEGAAHHFALGAGGVDHHAAGYHDAHVPYLGFGVVVEEDQVPFFQLAHAGDLLPIAHLGVTRGGEAAAVAARLLEAVVYKAAAIELAGPGLA